MVLPRCEPVPTGRPRKREPAFGENVLSLPPEILGQLSNAPLFAGLPNNLLDRHFGQSRRILAAGNTLRSLDEPGSCIYIVLSGSLRVNQRGQADVPTFGAGEAVSEMSLPDVGNAFDFLAAAADCELLRVDLAALAELANETPQAARNVLGMLAAGITLGKRSNRDSENLSGYAGLNFVDELTGLYNGQWMFKNFERHIQRSLFTKEPAVLMLTSIDQFDHYVRSYGDLGGDQALRTIAQVILTCLRPNDHAARYYGEVFAVYMPRTRLEEARIASKRLLEQVGRADIVTPTGDALPRVTLSIGMVEVLEDTPLQHLIEQATAAMHRKE